MEEKIENKAEKISEENTEIKTEIKNKKDDEDSGETACGCLILTVIDILFDMFLFSIFTASGNDKIADIFFAIIIINIIIVIVCLIIFLISKIKN